MTIANKTFKFFALATATLGLTVTAAHAEAVTFKRDGVSYEYTSTIEKGRTVLTGTADGVPFRFVVRGRYVTGHYDYRPVDFRAPTAKQTTTTTAVVVMR
jgi:hypothetical protein